MGWQRDLHHIDHFQRSYCSRDLPTCVFISFYQSRLIGCLFTALYCAVLCTSSITLNVHFCFAVVACNLVCLSHPLVFMGSQVQGANGSRPPLDSLQCIADNIFDDLLSYTGLAPPLQNYEAFEWETQAKTILRGQDFQSITQILRFRLYGHKDSLRQVLQRRWDCQLVKILFNLYPTGPEAYHQAFAKLSKAHKIEKILKLIQPTQTPSPVYWNWKPYKAANETDAGKIAADIDEESCSLFRRVPFSDWLNNS